MNTDLKARWVAALRSGKYKQGKSALQTWDGKFCCLGVLCDLIDPEGWELRSTFCALYNYKTDTRTGFLPDSLGLAIGLGEEFQSRLSQLNDGNETFEKIARIIETNDDWS